MKLFNRMLALLLVTVLFVMLVACGGNDTPDTPDGTTTVPSGNGTTDGTNGTTGSGDSTTGSGDETTGNGDETTGSGDETTGSGDETTAPVDDTFKNMTAQELVGHAAKDVEDWSKYESVTVSKRTEHGLDGSFIVDETVTTTIRVYNWDGKNTDYTKLRVYIREDYHSEAFGDVLNLTKEITIVKSMVYIREAADGVDISLTRMDIDAYRRQTDAIPGWLALNTYLPTYFNTLTKQEAGENFEVVFASPNTDKTLELLAQIAALLGFDYEPTLVNSTLENASGSSLYSKEGVLTETKGTFDFTFSDLNSKNHYEISTTYSFDVNALSIKEPENANSYLDPEVDE